MKKLSIIVLFALLLSLFIGCASTNTEQTIKLDATKYISQNLPIDYLCPDTLSWAPLKNKEKEIEGFSIIRHKLPEFRSSWTCIKADLNTEGLKIVASLNEEDLGNSPPLKHVKTFAKKNDAIVAVNATPWKNKEYPNDAVGIVKINGVEYFPPYEGYCAIAFSENPLRAHIYDTQIREELDKYNYAFGGFYQVLKDNKTINFGKTRRSRVAIGTNEDGSELYFFVISTHMLPKDRNGLTFEECGLILQKLGCSDAMQFDGGHSSCLVVNKKDLQKPLLNRKIPIAIGLKK